MPRVPAPNGLLSSTVNNAKPKGGHLLDAALHVNKQVALFVEKGQGPFYERESHMPIRGVCGKEKDVDATLDFAAYLCMGRSPCEPPGREKEQNRRVQR